MFKNANISYEIKNYKRRREIFYEMDPRSIRVKKTSNDIMQGMAAIAKKFLREKKNVTGRSE